MKSLDTRSLAASAVLLGAALLLAPGAPAQSADELSENTRQFVSVGDPVVALTNVTLIDGTGAAPRRDQTIVVVDGRIAAVGPSSEVDVPDGANVLDLAGHTVIPGMVGLHLSLIHI